MFLGGFTMMAFEIMSARIIAPYLGSSLYTWTSVIASVLSGIIIGSHIGGIVADRVPTPRLLGVLCGASGITAVIAFLIASVIGPVVSAAALPLWLLALLFCLAVFFPPAFVSAMLTPGAVRIRLATLAETGRVYGSLGAWNSAGSILGTYMTGFVFQAYLPTSVVWFFLAVALILAGMLGVLSFKRI